MLDYLSKLLPLLGFLAGLFLWRVQLIGKRRTEIAEEALLIFDRAVEALNYVRIPGSISGELLAMRKEIDCSQDGEIPGEKYRITLWRLQQKNDRFADLRRVQLLCRYHFGEDAYAAFESILSVKKDVWVAANMGLARLNTGATFTPEEGTRLIAREALIWAGVSEPDCVADTISKAQHDLEAVLKRHLRADAAFLPIADAWSAIRRRIIRSIGSSKPRGPDR
ncbi:MAG: hypothetical protein ING10_02815 [Roseomonas sp.]|nr:hypothetical protein [Roseomonas sp.]